MRAGFTFGGLTFEENRSHATDANGITRSFIAAGEAHCFPLGSVDTFGTNFAPADFNETVNPLPMCDRPAVLAKLAGADDHAGLLKEAVWSPTVGSTPLSVKVDIRAPDETVLDGLGLSTDYSIR